MGFFDPFGGGSSGGGGAAKQIETKQEGDYIYYRYVGDSEWKQLLDLNIIYDTVEDRVDDTIENIAKQKVDEAIAEIDTIQNTV